MTAALALTLAGGGNRAFYQMGILRCWGARLLPQLRAVAACSAGACVATLFFSGRADATREFWIQRRSSVTRNFDWSRLLRGERPAPHADVYRDTMIYAMRDGGLERLRALPFPLLVLAAGFHRRLPAQVAVVVGLSAYNAEKRWAPARVHPTFGRRLGFVPRVFDARTCETPEAVADLILASSATPPFTPIGRFQNHALLDGGLVDNVPAFVAEAVAHVTKNLVLLTRPYPSGVTGHRGHRLYVGPSRPTPVDRWDYTRPHLVDETVALGETDSERYAPLLDSFLAAAPTLTGDLA
jgi:predicted acylesterase/phospholipase RssA